MKLRKQVLNSLQLLKKYWVTATSHSTSQVIQNFNITGNLKEIERLDDEFEGKMDDQDGEVKFNADFSMLQIDNLQSIAGESNSENSLEFLYKPRLAIEEGYLKSDITTITLVAGLSAQLAELIRSLKRFLKVYEGKIERTKSDRSKGWKLNNLQAILKTMKDIYEDCNVFLKCEAIGRVFLSLKEKLPLCQIDGKTSGYLASHNSGSKGGQFFGNVFGREITLLKLHMQTAFGEGDPRIGYILSIIPRLASRIFRNNLKYIQNKQIDETGWHSLNNMFDNICRSISDLGIKE